MYFNNPSLLSRTHPSLLPFQVHGLLYFCLYPLYFLSVLKLDTSQHFMPSSLLACSSSFSCSRSLTFSEYVSVSIPPLSHTYSPLSPPPSPSPSLKSDTLSSLTDSPAHLRPFNTQHNLHFFNCIVLSFFVKSGQILLNLVAISMPGHAMAWEHEKFLCTR